MILNTRKLPYKLCYTHENRISGESIVRIKSDYGVFEGKSYCHPDDNYGSFFGMELAEKRAVLKLMKCRKNIISEQLKLMEIYYDTISQKKTFNSKCNEANHARRYIEFLSNELKYYNESIKGVKENIEFSIEAREKYSKKINDIVQKNKTE